MLWRVVAPGVIIDRVGEWNARPGADEWTALVVDDDDGVRRTFERCLLLHGWRVVTASDGRDAVAHLGDADFDVIVSDVSMPDMSGIELLRHVRGRDLELPVILVTGAPTVETAAEAVNQGAFRYLSKPVLPDSLVAAARHAGRVRRLARAKREAMELVGRHHAMAADRAGVEAQLEAALAALWVAYQPIVSVADQGGLFAYEALMRTREPALQTPGALIEAALRLHRIVDLGRAVRTRAVEPIDLAPPPCALFVNLHPSELEDRHLLDRDSAIARVADRIVLEITERAALDSIRDVSVRIAALREVGYRIALDDLGAGYSGLSCFAQLEPDFVKLDMSLVRGVEGSQMRQKVIRSITSLCADLCVKVVGEGVETAAERDVLIGLGCEYLQGFRFARPGPAFPVARW
jgi:EAL domain-containing protein (putative c-di-GMP-specific phosphodiesterase class I)